MSKLHIKKGDTVIVLAGKDKGKKGNVQKVLVEDQRVIVEGINMVSKSTKPSAKNPQGGIVKQEAPIHVSNVSLIDPKSGKATRVSIKHEGKNVVRIAKRHEIARRQRQMCIRDRSIRTLSLLSCRSSSTILQQCRFLS